MKKVGPLMSNGFVLILVSVLILGLATACSSMKTKNSSKSILLGNISLRNYLRLNKKIVSSKKSRRGRYPATEEREEGLSTHEIIEQRLSRKGCLSDFDITPFVEGFMDDEAKSIVVENRAEFKHYLETGHIPLAGRKKGNPRAMWCANFAEGHGFSHTAFISKKLKLGGKIFEPIIEVTAVQGFDHDEFFSRASSRIRACSPYINTKSLDLVIKAIHSDDVSKAGESVKLKDTQIAHHILRTGEYPLLDEHKSNAAAINCAAFAEGIITGNITGAMIVLFIEAFSKALEGMFDGIEDALSPAVNQSSRNKELNKDDKGVPKENLSVPGKLPGTLH